MQSVLSLPTYRSPATAEIKATQVRGIKQRMNDTTMRYTYMGYMVHCKLMGRYNLSRYLSARAHRCRVPSSGDVRGDDPGLPSTRRNPAP